MPINLQCDEKRPACEQCEKAARCCPGYPGEARRAVGSPASPSSQAHKSPPHAVAQNQQLRHGGQNDASGYKFTICLNGAPDTPVMERAECLFVSNFVLVAPKGTNRGFYEFIVPLTQASSSQSVAVTYAFRACALKYLSNRYVSDSRLEKAAAEFHTRAITLTISALENASRVSNDDTIGSILLLILFEFIASTESRKLAWRSHLSGAMELVKARGRSQLMNEVGSSIFIAVRVQLVRITRMAGPGLTSMLQQR